MKFDFVLQGPIYPETNRIVSQLLCLPFCNKIIISSWEGAPDLQVVDERISILRNKDVLYPGIGNINRQIESSIKGLLKSTCDYCIKMRTDQIISYESYNMMYKFFNKFNTNEVLYLAGNGPHQPIFVLGMYTRFPFHPRDHMFWGHKEDLISLFNIPHCNHPSTVDNVVTMSDAYWSQVIRPESYLGMHYYSKFDSSIKHFITNYKDYIVDMGCNKHEALAKYNTLRDKVFKVFPRVDMEWPKHNLKQYHYLVGESFSEYWHDSSW